MLLLKLSKIERTDYRRGEYVEDDGDSVESHPVEQTRAVFVIADKIRNFQPRRDNKPGSRLTFVDGGGYAVQESVEEIIGFLEGEVRGRSADVIAMTQQIGHSPN